MEAIALSSHGYLLEAILTKGLPTLLGYVVGVGIRVLKRIAAPHENKTDF